MRILLTLLIWSSVNTCLAQSYELSILLTKNAIRAGNNDQARFFIEKGIAKYPDSAECYYQRGAIFFFTNQMDSALLDFNKAEALGYTQSQLFKIRGVIFHYQSKFELAEKEYAKFLIENPDDTVIQIKHAATIFEQRKYEEALQAIEPFQTNNPEYVDGYLLLGMIAFDQSKFDLSIDHFTKAIDLDSTQARSFYLRALAHKAIGDSKSTCEDFLQSINLQRYETMDEFRTYGCDELLDFDSPDSPYEYPLPPPQLIPAND